MSFTPRFLKHRGITVIQKLDPSIRRVPRGKVGLVLAGGAVAGGAFKAGGLRALDESLVRRRPGGATTDHAFGLNEFDVFVGLSAGSVLAAVLSAGIVPDEIFRILAGTSEMYETFQPWHFMRPNFGDWTRVTRWLGKEQELFTNWLSGATDSTAGGRFALGTTLRKMAQATSRLLPTGLFDPRALEEYLRRQMARAGIRDDFAAAFAQTGKALYLTATDLNRG
ncbi:MAG: patatin-like phospholipase family protein, partial [Polyangia bacterium]